MSADKLIIALVSFVVGAAIGALLGLAFAPMSGRELQYRVRKEGQLQTQKARAEWMQAQNNWGKQVDGLKQQLQSATSRS